MDVSRVWRPLEVARLSVSAKGPGGSNRGDSRGDAYDGAFDFTGSNGGVLFGRVCWPREPPFGSACGRGRRDVVPEWTRVAVPATPVLDLTGLDAYFQSALAGRTPQGRSWTGSIMLAMRVLEVVDALVVSCRAPVPVDVALARRFYRLMPAPGGALDRLAAHTWAYGCALVHELVARVGHARRGGAGSVDWQAVDDALSRVTPFPVWNLGRWGGRAGDPPRETSGEVAYLLGAQRPVKLIQWVESRAATMRGPLSMSERRLLPPSSSRWWLLGDLRGGLSRSVDRMRTYQRMAGDAWQLPLVLLRLLAHMRFGARIVTSGGHRGLGTRDLSRRRAQHTRFLVRLCDLEELDPLLMHNLLFHGRMRLEIDPLDLLAAERWLAMVWDRYASVAFGVVRGGRPGNLDDLDAGQVEVSVD